MMRHSLQRCLNVFVIGLFCASTLTAAQRTFVSAANGNDANPCTPTLPCRSFAAAITLTDADGEVIVLDSGGYGAVTITQPVSIISPTGVYAGITVFSGNGITVNAGDTAHVVLKNLMLSSFGGYSGIQAQTVAHLYIDSCEIAGFSHAGVEFDPLTTGARLDMTHTVVRRSGNSGIRISGGTGILAAIESTQLIENNPFGIFVQFADALITRTEVSGASGTGFFAYTGSRVTVESSAATKNVFGFYASGGMMTMTRCTSTFNSYGLQAAASGALYVSDSTVTGNDTGIITSTGGVVVSRSDNTVQSNTSNGAFSGTYSAQ